MKEENQNKIFEAFPRLYQGRYLSNQENLMCYGFEVPDAWFPIIWKLSEKLEALYNSFTPEQRKAFESKDGEYKFVATQVKSKLAGLRFYMDIYNETANKTISEAEQISMTTCEICASPSQIRSYGGWLITLCEEHHQERLNLSKKSFGKDKDSLDKKS